MSAGLSVMQISELMGSCDDAVIFNGLVKTNSIVNDDRYKNIMCSISGGSDSDIMMDICQKVDVDKKIKYVWFDTGIEWQATKDHLAFLEKKYDVEIIRERAAKSILYSVKTYGQPFLSKFVSKNMETLQRHGFQWENGTGKDLIKQYCEKADLEKKEELSRLAAVEGRRPYHWRLIDGDWYTGGTFACVWWTNGNGENAKTARARMRFNIEQNKFLKEFIMKNPPTFKISVKCCTYAKKAVAHKFVKDNSIDLSLVGIRKAEGGFRSTAYKNCYSIMDAGPDYHRPIFYYTEATKRNYERQFGITHSRCYTEYGMKRTGCAGCPFNKRVFDEAKIMAHYEPKLWRAAQNIFAESYEYTRRYREFQRRMAEKEKLGGQMTIFDLAKEADK